MPLRLPSGYHAQLNPDVLVLERADGSVVASFSGRGFVAEEVERAAWQDYSEAAEGPSLRRVPSGLRHPPSRPRSDPLPPRPPA